MGTCEYVLSQPCDSDDFIIVGRNTPVSGNPSASEIEAVRIIVKDGPEIFLSRRESRRSGGQITINDVLQPNVGDGVVYNLNGVQVFRKGGNSYVLLTLEGSFPVEIYWDGRRRVRITVSDQWQGLLCGQCGNYNENRTDDYILCDGSLTTAVDTFASSWEHNKTTPGCGIPPKPPNCSVLEEAKQRCSVLNDPIFQSCHNVEEPTPLFENCIFDYCNCDESDKEGCLCGSVRNYAALCGSKFISIPNAQIAQICHKLSTA